MAFKLVLQSRNLRVVTDKSSVSAYVNQAPKVNFEITNYLKPQVGISFRNLQATDILLDAFNLNRRFLNTLSISEQLAFELGTAFTDSYGFADTTSVTTNKSINSSYSFDDFIASTVDKGIADNVSFESSATVLLEYLRGFDNTLGLSDEVLTEAIYLRELASAFTLDDFLTAGIEDVEKVTEGNKGNIFGLVSETGFDLSRFIQSNTPLVSEPELSFATGFFSEGFITDSDIKSINIGKPDVSFVTFADFENKLVSKKLVDTSTLLDEQTVASEKPVSSSYSIGDLPTLSFSTENENVISSTDEINLSPEKSLASNYNLESSTVFVNAFNRSFALDDVSFTDALSFDLPRSLADTASLGSENANSISKPIHEVLQSLSNAGGATNIGLQVWDHADIAWFIDEGRDNNDPPLRSEHEHLFDGFSSGEDYLDSLNISTYNRNLADSYYNLNSSNNRYSTDWIYELLSGHEDEDNFSTISELSRSVSKIGGRRFLEYSDMTSNEFLDLFEFIVLLAEEDSTALAAVGDKYDIFDRGGTGTIQLQDAISHLDYWGKNNPASSTAMDVLAISGGNLSGYPRTNYISDILAGNSNDAFYQGTSLTIIDQILVSLHIGGANSIPNQATLNASTFN